ncbi:MAG: hypothetical protein EOO27_23920 [Comamonadaceae bacterium]|nr:MAG: hypothetical protein EOO27_23920 [Comamonadaceae bacterium]
MANENPAKTAGQNIDRMQAAAELRARFEHVVLGVPIIELPPMKQFLACDGSVAGCLQLKRIARKLA